MSFLGKLNTIVEKDFFATFCGERLGSGIAREVFAYLPDPRYVVKIEDVAKSFQNVREWDVWDDAQYMDDEIRSWLAPCKTISPAGTVLIQRRTTPVMRHELPDKVPAFLGDLKPENFGKIGKRIVAHDYGCHLVCNSGLTKRKVKANWDE